MPRKARPHPKPKRQPTFIREWRKHRGLTQVQLLDRLLTEGGVELTDGQLSRIERGEQPYNQDLLEALSKALRCEPADLIMRNPSDPVGLWSIYDLLNPVERKQLVEMGKVLKGTGTNG